MKSLKIKFLVGAVAIAIFFGVLTFLKCGNTFSPEKKIEGIEEVGVSFENFSIPKDVRVVGIGEGSHGNKEFQIAKKEVLQKVVNEGDGRSISFELSVGEGAMINDAIHESETDLTELVGELSYPLYDTEEIVDLLSWMRDFNQNVPYEESIMLYGVDMQGAYKSIEYMQGLCEQGTSFFAEDEKETIMSLDADSEDYASERDFFDGLSNRLLATEDIESKQLGVVVKALVQSIDAPEFGGYDNEYGIHRDKSMAENLKTFSEIEEARGYTQVVITAHNGHVMKGSQLQGEKMINIQQWVRISISFLKEATIASVQSFIMEQSIYIQQAHMMMSMLELIMTFAVKILLLIRPSSLREKSIAWILIV